MDIPVIALHLAGFVLAHAAWSVSDLPDGELLVPLAIIEEEGERRLVRFEAETQEEAIANGKAAMEQARATADAWAFAREGLFPDGETKIDVLVVSFWARGMDQPAVLIQRFEPFAKEGQFKVLGPVELVTDGEMQPREVTKATLRSVSDGIASHPKVAPLWKEWQAD